ncbi:MAG: DUF433 domain-containing protein [Rhodanobacteraceae bacterium]|jgi:uncharacterized protein (DUF433 family)|nr:DUF433 domain-containing protein [Rhodanobacteraceae bacterium]
MNWKDHIVATADTCAGKPRIKGTRITVELILDNLAAGRAEAQIIESYPHLAVEQIRAAVAFASSRVGQDSSLTGFEAAT